MKSKLYIFVALFICYYIFSGINEPFFLAAGVISSLFGVLLISRMKLAAEYPSLNLNFFRYLVWLVKEIIFSTIDVVKQIYSRKLPAEAGFATIKTKQKTALGYTLFGNSITLTPGTVCVKINDKKGEIIIHSLLKKGREDLQNGGMDSQVLEALK